MHTEKNSVFVELYKKNSIILSPNRKWGLGTYRKSFGLDWILQQQVLLAFYAWKERLGPPVFLLADRSRRKNNGYFFLTSHSHSRSHDADDEGNDDYDHLVIVHTACVGNTYKKGNDKSVWKCIICTWFAQLTHDASQVLGSCRQ